MIRTLRVIAAAAVAALFLVMVAGAVHPSRVAAAPSYGVASPTGWVELKPGEQKLLDDLNWTRAQANLSNLTLDALVTAAARDRSADMANRHYFAHKTPEGKDFLDTLKQWGVGYRLAGEIIARNNYPATQSADEANHGFMNSPAHKNIIMMTNWKTVGVGQSVDGSGMFYYTVLFVQPKGN